MGNCLDAKSVSDILIRMLSSRRKRAVLALCVAIPTLVFGWWLSFRYIHPPSYLIAITVVLAPSILVAGAVDMVYSSELTFWITAVLAQWGITYVVLSVVHAILHKRPSQQSRVNK